MGGGVIPIWIVGASKPVRFRFIRGTSELLLGIDIVKKLDPPVNFGIDQCKVGRSEWRMMTFDERRRWVFPLSQLLAIMLN